MDDKEREEKIGRTVAGFAWFLFVVKFLIVVSVIALPVMYFLGQPIMDGTGCGCGCIYCLPVGMETCTKVY